MAAHYIRNMNSAAKTTKEPKMSINQVMSKRQSQIEATLRGVRDMADMAAQNADICDEGRATFRRLHDHIAKALADADQSAAEAVLALLAK